MPDTLSIIDNRTGKRYEVPVKDGTIRAMDLRQIKVSDEDFGLMTYDPAFTNTASCRSAITYIDGDKGILDGDVVGHRLAGDAVVPVDPVGEVQQLAALAAERPVRRLDWMSTTVYTD